MHTEKLKVFVYKKEKLRGNLGVKFSGYLNLEDGTGNLSRRVCN
jgi:hypothetical protein